MKKESFIIYKSFYQPIKKLRDQQLGNLFRALFLYQITGEEPPEDSDILMPFEFFKNQFDLDAAKYEKVVEKNQRNGKKGGRPKKPNNPQGFQEPKKPDNDNVTVKEKEKDNDNVNALEERKLAFADSLKQYLSEYPKPMLLEFFEYWTEHGERDKKMRFEKQTSFAISRRLKTWEKNTHKFDKSGGQKNNSAKVDDDYILELKKRLS